jgi:hypothetical protein
MTRESMETDYLVIGCGAAALAFTDALLEEAPDARFVIVDRRHRPGGHWNDAYPFVRLHQPASMYGVNSRELGTGQLDRTGLNAGLGELASRDEVLQHFARVMEERLLPSGRVRYFPMCEHELGPDRQPCIRNLVSGATHELRVRRRHVDATLARTQVPATHPPAYAVAAGVDCIPINGLVDVRTPRSAYVVVGAGKTGMDACLWLLQSGVDPERIRWIMPRDAWLQDRADFQPRMEFFDRTFGAIVRQLEAIAQAASVGDLFARLESEGLLLRLDPQVEPTMYRCATVTQAELRELRRIRQVVRLGRVQAVDPGQVVLEHGTLEIPGDALVVDCSAYAFAPAPQLPVFDGERIHLQMVRTCQPVFSAALIGYVEGHSEDDARKNRFCAVVPTPVDPLDWLRMWAVNLQNIFHWGRDPGVMGWLMRARLDGISALVRAVEPGDAGKQALIQRYGQAARRAALKLPKLLAPADLASA